MRDGMHDWVLANENMARVLAAKGYHCQFAFVRNAGHGDKSAKEQTLPAALRWLWHGCPIARAARSPAAVVFNPEEAILRRFHSEKMAREMIHCFFDEAGALFPQMLAALEKGDLEEVGRLGDRTKGTAAYLGAQPAKAAALQVERFCKSSGGTLAEAAEAINTLEHECLVLKAAASKHPLAADPAQGD